MFMNTDVKLPCSQVASIELTDYSRIKDETHRNKCKAIQENINNKNYSIHVFNEDRQGNQESLKVFDYYAGDYWTQQYVGVLLHDNQKVIIGSRFDTAEKQFFLNYVFCKAYGLNPNIFQEMNPTCDMEKTWDLFLIIMFLETLEKAFKKGYYKEYTKNQYNDAKLKGPINVARHIKENMLFSGNIAYSRRENSIDNPINNLILYTLKHINVRYNNFAKNRIKEKNDFKDCIDYLIYTIHENDVDKKTLIKNTQKPVTRHIFHDYEKVRVLARLILKNMGLNIFSESRKSVKGVLLNMEKLWENFLEKTFFADVSLKYSYELQTQKALPILFNEGQTLQTIRPDFVLSQNKIPVMVLDAKYKNYAKENEDFKVKREDIYQVLSYMYAYEVQHGGSIFPVIANEAERNHQLKTFTLWNKKNTPQFYTLPIVVPQACNYFLEYCKQFDEDIKNMQAEFFFNKTLSTPQPHKITHKISIK